jgi:hypothetical protein
MVIEKYYRLTDPKYVDLVRRAPIGYANDINDFIRFINDHQDHILSIGLQYDAVMRTLNMHTEYSCACCCSKAVAKHTIMIFRNVEPAYHELLDEIYCPLPTAQARLITSLIFEEIIGYLTDRIEGVTVYEPGDWHFEYDYKEEEDEDDEAEEEKSDDSLDETMRIWRGYTGANEMGQL